MSFNNKMKYSFSDNDPNCMIFSDGDMSGKLIEKDINNELFIVKSSLYSTEDIKLESSTKTNGLMLSYNLLGYSEHKGKDKDFFLKLDTDESNMCIIKEENSISSGPKGLINKICFIIKKEFIEKSISDNRIKDYILSSLEKDVCQELVFKRKTNDYINLILQDLFKLNFEEGLNDLYLQSKILEILFLELNTIIDKQTPLNKDFKLDEYDIEAIKKAKEILLENIQNPPSIIELSKMVAINDFKLKKGFKEVFKTTPYNLLLDYKLELARKLLKEGEMSVNEIAKSLGYRYTQSFSKSFIKRYGIPPKKLMKSRDYYY